MAIQTPFGPLPEPGDAPSPPPETSSAPNLFPPPSGDLGRDLFSSVHAEVLVVDQDAAAAAELGKWLSGQGHAVTLAGCAEMADAILKTAGFDVIFASASLASGDGQMWLEQVLDRPACPPVVATSTSPSLSIAIRAANLPLAGYFVRPYDFEALHERLELLFRCSPPRLRHGRATS